MPLLHKIGKVLAVALCCMLMLFMTAEAAHAHPANVPDAAHCPLCIAAHVALHSASALMAGVVLAGFGQVAECAAAAGFSANRDVRRIRPPPASLRA